MKLLKNQSTVLDTLKNGPISTDEIVNKTKLDSYVVKNILMEFYDAELIIKTDNGSYSLRSKPTKSYDKEPTQWQPVKLKNLSRIL
jgi:hypothetical protein